MRKPRDNFRRNRANGNVIFLCCLGLIVVYYGRTWPDEPVKSYSRSTDTAGTHLIISSYLKGGGTLVGEVFGRRADTFYTFEPLFARAMWSYYKTNTTTCKLLQNKCDEVDGGTVRTALDMVASNYNCKTTAMVDKFYHPRWDKGGPPWLLFHQCLDERNDAIFCNKILNTSCAHASNRVVKVNRLSVRHLGQLLKENDKLKVLHIFRDPRGIITSRMKTSWYPQINSPETLRTNAEALCMRIEDDFEQGIALTKLYPSRFRMILFEDFQANIDNVFRQLLHMFNLRYTPEDHAHIEAAMTSVEAQQYASAKASIIDELSVNPDGALNPEGASSATSVNPFRWRESVDFETVGIIDSVCGSLYKTLGYNVYENEDKLRDIESWPGFGGGGIPPL